MRARPVRHPWTQSAVIALLAFSSLLSGCPAQQQEPSLGGSAPADAAPASLPLVDAAPEPFESWYPAQVVPPPGTSYPCALTPLPPGLPGIPAADQRFVDHVYSQLLEATHAKLALFQALRSAKPAVQRGAFSEYDAQTLAALDKIGAEPVPAGLEPFHADVLAAIELQRSFFSQATEQLAEVAARLPRGADATAERKRVWGAAWKAMFQIPEGRRASHRLLAAWSKMQARYPAWPAATKDSVYHHLCALDLF